MNKLLLVFLTSISILMISCSDLSPDPIDPRLPKYTQDGLQISGALINEEVWIQNASGQINDFIAIGFIENTKPQMKCYKDSITLKLPGNTTHENITIHFSLNEGAQSYADILALDNKKIILDGINSLGKLSQGPSSTFTGGIGQMYFKHISRDDSGNIILSGTFGFELAATSGKGYIIQYGRFDYLFEEYENLNFHIED